MTDTLTAPWPSIQHMARRSGRSEHTLRYHEDIGLIGPIPRDGSSGHRRSSPEAAERIEALACLRATGMSIDDPRTCLSGLAAVRLRLDDVRAEAELSPPTRCSGAST